ncbi:MAG: hypothetical protein JW395_4190 [Nitrospira sp.]|nr:hypothetical protein [Nitrospira sp.]
MPRQPRIIRLHNSVAKELASYKRWGIQSYAQKRDLPHGVVRGLLLGLLSYFTRPAMRHRLSRVHLETLTDCLLAFSDTKRSHAPTGRKRQKRTDTDKQITRRSVDDVHKILPFLLQHPSPYILELESKWLMQILAEYRTLPVENRLQWVEKKVHRLFPKARDPLLAYGLLGGLLRVTRCPRTDCKCQTTIPSRGTLDMWTRHAGSGVRELSYHILAYYHGSSYGTVKRRLLSRSSR